LSFYHLQYKISPFRARSQERLLLFYDWVAFFVKYFLQAAGVGAVQEVKGSPIFLTFKKENMIKFSHEQRKK